MRGFRLGVCACVMSALSLTAMFSDCGKKPGQDAAPPAAVVNAVTYDTFADGRDGKKYKAVKIGGRTWMAEDLNYQADNSWATEICEPNGDGGETCSQISRLYDWAAAKTACPAGWRLPDTADWGELVRVAGGDEIAGKKLKSKSGWNNGNDGKSGGGTDDYGFSALPGGYRHFTDGDIRSVGYNGMWWTATESGSGDAYGISMGNNDGYVSGPDNFNKGSGFSVRCVEGAGE